MAAQAHIGHVDPQLAENGGDGGQSTVFIVVADHQRVVVSGEADVDAVQLVHHDAAAADGGGLQLQLLAVGVPDLDDRRVGVGVPQVDLIHGEVQTRLLRLLKGEGDPHIVGVHAQQTRHQRPIGAVAGAGLGKGAVEVDLGLHRLTAQQCTGHLADAGRSGGVGAGGTHHHRA